MVQPWQYQLTDEDWKNLHPTAGLAKVASAVSAGQQAYQQAQQDALIMKQKQQAFAPKKQYAYNAKAPAGEQFAVIGELPAEATSADVRDVTPGKITRWNQALNDGKGGYETSDEDFMKKYDIEKEGKSGGQSGSYELTDSDADIAAKQIASGTLSPAIVNKYYSQRTGSGIKNTIKINNALAKLGIKDPITGEALGVDIGDYTQSYTQEQKNKISYANSENAIKDMELMIKGAEKIGNGNFKDWNRLKLNFMDRTGADAVAAFKAEAAAAIDSISLALGPAGGTGATDKRLELAAKTVNESQSVSQIKSAMESVRKFVENRKNTFSDQGLEGWRARNIQGYVPGSRGSKPKASESFTSNEGVKTSNIEIKKNSNGKFVVTIP